MPLTFMEPRKNIDLPEYDAASLQKAFDEAKTQVVFKASVVPRAVRGVQNFLASHDMSVALTMDSRNIPDLPMLEQYIDEYYQLQLGDSQRLKSINFNHHESMRVPVDRRIQPETGWQDRHPDSLCPLIEKSIKPFSSLVQDLMEKKEMNLLETYKNANMDRFSFLELLENPRKIPDKNTLCALGLALELEVPELECLLEKYDLALLNNSIADLIVRFYMEQGVYDIQTINLSLFKHAQPLLGTV